MKYRDLEGIEVRVENNGGLICDTRKSVTKPKYVGGIIPHPLRPGYCFCPLTVRSFIFDRRIPKDNFRTPARAADWLKKYSVCYTNRRYTIFNPLIKCLFDLPGSIISNIRTQLIIIQVILAFLLLFYPSPPDNVTHLILIKAIAVVLVLGAAMNTYLLLRGR